MKNIIEFGATTFEIGDKSFFGVYQKYEDGLIEIIEEFQSKGEAFSRAAFLGEKSDLPVYLR
tara:strand:- start:10418 stop:10603 length:186 start_codon:yes stop_codon:yes gene_type:complete